MTSVAVIDYGMGNVQSVVNALEFVGAKAILTRDPALIQSSDRIVLPGVGAFGDGMKNLRDFHLIPILEEEVLHKKKPFLGICLGMQLLATTGLEHGRNSGLNWIGGLVDRLPSAEQGLRVPHMGWNDVKPLGAAFYFVHSYHLIPDNKSVVSGWCEYGIPFCAAVQKENIWGAQFHPEKSHKDGIRYLQSFLKYSSSVLHHA